VSRGPLNVASFLMGTTDFLTEMKAGPEKVHQGFLGEKDFKEFAQPYLNAHPITGLLTDEIATSRPPDVESTAA
jgi:hypothetical protein